MYKPLTHKKRLKIFAKVIRENTGHDFIVCQKLSKKFLNKSIYLDEHIMYPFETRWSVMDSDYNEEEVFTGGVYLKDDKLKEVWEIPSEFYLWQR